MSSRRPHGGLLARLHDVLVAAPIELFTLGDAIADALLGPLADVVTVSTPEDGQGAETIGLGGSPGHPPSGALAHTVTVSLRDAERPVGTLRVTRAAPYGEDDIAVVAQAGALAGRAVANALVVRQLETTARITRAMAGNVDLDQLFEAVLPELRSALGLDTVLLLLLDEPRALLRVRLSLGSNLEAAASVPVGAGFAGRIAAEQRPLIVPDTASFPHHSPTLRGLGLASLAGVPVTYGRPLGVLVVGSVTPRRFRTEEVELLALVADRLGMAIHQSETEAALRRSEAAAAAVLETAADGILTFDDSGVLQGANPSVERMFGYSASELVGAPLSQILDFDAISENLTARVSRVTRQEVTGRRRDGTQFPVEVARSSVGNAMDGQLFTAVVRDVTEQRATEDQLRQQALYDGLTALPNRILFAEHLDAALARARREGSQIGVMFLDLDRFKHVNDSLGHAAGDELLRQAAGRLGRAVRPTDVLSRLGGDEFAVLLTGVMPRDATTVARRILRRFERPFELEGREVQTTTSIGIAHGVGEDQSARDLLRHADAALYLAKGAGRGRFEVFDEPMRAWLHDRLEVENELRVALQSGQIVVHYQPLLHLDSGRIDSVEALVRWQHPTRGILTAGDFIEVAQESGLIVPIGLQVVGAAAEQLTRWHHELGDAAPSIAVNLSARELAVPIDPLLEAAQDKISWLGIELSETTLMADAEREAGHRRELQRHGARIIIDDFGMGYSSLARLSRMQVAMIKIAKEFVDGVCTVARDRAAVDAIIRLAHALGVAVVAEGVETSGQLEALRELGCDLAQGNFIASACPADELVLTPR